MSIASEVDLGSEPGAAPVVDPADLGGLELGLVGVLDAADLEEALREMQVGPTVQDRDARRVRDLSPPREVLHGALVLARAVLERTAPEERVRLRRGREALGVVHGLIEELPGLVGLLLDLEREAASDL